MKIRSGLYLGRNCIVHSALHNKKTKKGKVDKRDNNTTKGFL